MCLVIASDKSDYRWAVTSMKQSFGVVCGLGVRSAESVGACLLVAGGHSITALGAALLAAPEFHGDFARRNWRLFRTSFHPRVAHDLTQAGFLMTTELLAGVTGDDSG